MDDETSAGNIFPDQTTFII